MINTVIVSQKKTDSEQPERVVSNSNPSSVMATRHYVTHLHNACICSMLAVRKHYSLFMSRRRSILCCESKLFLFSLLKHEAASVIIILIFWGPAGSNESQPVSMVNNKCLYFQLSVQNRKLWQWA